MRNGDFPESGPADRLGRMLLISMVFHVAVFGALVWYNSKTLRVKPLLPTYTVDSGEYAPAGSGLGTQDSCAIRSTTPGAGC